MAEIPAWPTNFSLRWWSGEEGGQAVGVIETADSFVFVFRGSQDSKDFVVDLKSQVIMLSNMKYISYIDFM